MNRKQRRANKSHGQNPVVQELTNEGLRHHQAGRLAEAERLYRQALGMDPQHADSLHLVGVLAHQIGRHDAAADLIGQAIAVRGDVPAFHNNLANALKAQGQLDEAAASYRRALALKPDYADALNNLGVILKSQGRQDEAAGSYERALKLNPDSAETHNNLGNIRQSQEKFDDAVAAYKNAIALKPDYAEAHYNMGNVLKAQEKLDEAFACYERALALKPDYIDAVDNLSTAFIAQGKFDHAAKCYRYALDLAPGNPEYMNKLGCALLYRENPEEAISLFERALVLMPDDPGIFNNLASAYKRQGRLDEAIVCYKKAISLKPYDNLKYSNLLLAMIYAESVSPQELATTAREFGKTLADPFMRSRPMIRDRDLGRKLRVGYVSPDFREHAVNYFFEFLLKWHDREQFEIFAYSSSIMEDNTTARLKPKFDHWRNIRALSDDRAADLIEADRIDVLVDLAGHTADNRLLVFARKPAPVQVTWLGYPATTGMKAMDYRITDRYAEPAGMTEHLNVETLWRLPEIFCCYNGHENSPVVIDHPPFEDNGYITLGCFNNFSKVTDFVLDAWVQIMARVPKSRLLLEIAGLEGPLFHASTEKRLRRLGLPMDRVILEQRKKENQFVLYNRLDIALDPFPCVGGTTSFDTLWMGVPFITLAGGHFVSRMGVTILTNAGMPELIAKSREEYVRLAVDLALDKDRLRGLRHNLRQRIAASPLTDQQTFTRNMEDAYRGMWGKWCAAKPDAK